MNLIIASALRSGRTAAWLSQDDLSMQSGIPKTTIARFETGEGNITIDQYFSVIKVLKRFGVELDIGDTGYTITINQSKVKPREFRSDRKQR